MAIFWYFASIIVVVAFSQPENAVAVPANAVKRTIITLPVIPFYYSVSRGLPEDLVKFMSISISTISGTLATYLGLVLGFSQARDRARVAMRDQPVTPAASIPAITPIQSAAAWSYVASLILALLFWAFKENPLDDVVVNLGRSILGLFGGVLAVILNVPESGRPPLPPAEEARNR